jgi:hypothetical protein
VKPYDNVPVVSWLVLRGRCRHCGAPISPRYPVVELLTALVFAAVVLVRGFDDDLVLELPFVAALIALAGIDLDHKLLPNRIVYPMAAYGVIATLLVDRGDLVEHLVAGAGAFTFLLVAALAYPRGMGMGAPDGVPDRLDRRHCDDRARGRGGPQEGRAVRGLPRHRRHRRRARGPRARGRLQDEFPRLAAEQSGWCPASLDISSSALSVSSGRPIPLCVRP